MTTELTKSQKTAAKHIVALHNSLCLLLTAKKPHKPSTKDDE